MAVPSDFFEVHWVDVVIWVIGFAVCLFGSFGSLRMPKSGKQVKKKGSANADGPMVRFHKITEAALVALGVSQRPVQRSEAELVAEQSEDVISQARPGCVTKIMDALDQNMVDVAFESLKEMQRLDLNISPNIIDRMLQHHTPKEACGLFRRMQDAGVTPNIVMYNCLLASCVNGSDMQRARTVFEEMRQVVAEPDSTSYWTLLKGCTCAGDLKGAKHLLAEMALSAHNKPTEPLYNALINAAFTAGDIQMIWDTTEMMKKSGVRATGHTAQVVMEVLRHRSSHRKLRSEDVARVMEFLDESGINFSTNQLLLSTVIDACVWHTEHKRLESILQQYFNSGLKPAVRVYGLLLKAANALNNIDWVWKLWHEMVDERELQPTEVVLGCMLDALVRSKLVDEATRILREWKEKVPPTTVMYATLAKGYLNTKQFPKAMQMLNDMRSEGVPRSLVVYNMIIGVHAENGALDDLPELIQSMRTDGFPPDAITYSSAVKGHCLKGDLDGALNLLREGRQSGVVFDAVIYGTIFFGCSRHNRQDLTDQLVSQMRSLGLMPASFALSTIVKLYGSQGRLLRALEVVDVFSSQVDTRVVNTLLDECTKNSKVDIPEHAFQLFLTSFPEAKFFWPVVACRVQRGEFQLAQVLVKARRASLHAQSKESSKVELMEQLLSALKGQKRKERTAMNLIEELRIC